MEKRAGSDGLSELVGVLNRRHIEARILAPIIDALADEFGRDRVTAIVASEIAKIARQEGAALAHEYGTDVSAFVKTLEFWKRDAALEIEILEQNAENLDFDVTRCRYAELYHALGLEHLGATLSCNRDHTFIEGFNRDATLKRDQTIMQGAPCCTFRYRFPKPEDSKTE